MINKVKNWLGIEGVTIDITSAERIKGSDTISVSMDIVTKSPQYIERLTLTVKERYRRGRRKSKLVDEYTLGEKTIEVGREITPGDVITLQHDIAYALLKSDIDRMASDGGIFSKIVGNAAKVIKGAYSEYYVVAELHVKGNALKPYSRIDVEGL